MCNHVRSYDDDFTNTFLTIESCDLMYIKTSNLFKCDISKIIFNRFDIRCNNYLILSSSTLELDKMSFSRLKMV